MQTIGNPWNPLPGWRFPGLLDESLAPSVTSSNRGAFDAVGLPWAFAVRFPDQSGEFGGQPDDVVLRVMQTNGVSGAALQASIELAQAQLGADAGRAMVLNWFNDQFATARNATFATIDPFWSRSAQVHPLWIGAGYVLTCNTNHPPEPVAPDPVPDPYEWPLGNSLARWSLYQNGLPADPVANYPLWQSDDAQSAETESLPADVFRAGVFPFSGMVLRGRTSLNYGLRVSVSPHFL